MTPQGTVAKAEVLSSTVRNSELEECIVGRLRQWNFPRSSHGGSTVSTCRFGFKDGQMLPAELTFR